MSRFQPTPALQARTSGSASKRAALGTAILGLVLLLAPHSATAQQDKAGPGNQPPPSVDVETARIRDVAEQRSFTGRIQAIDKVRIRARVQGFLKARNFDEGAEVKKDALLFEIEKEPYQAALALAEANVAGAKAALSLARATRARVNELDSRGTASVAQGDEARSKEAQAEATLQARQADLDRARLDLSYTDIRSPLDGRTGRATYSVGELVGPSSDPLVTVVAQDPMWAAFPVPQRVLLQVRREGRGRESVAVRLQLADGSTYEHDGVIKFAEVESNVGSDTVTVRASFPNPKRLLVDQQLVGVTVIAKEPEPRLLISQSAIQLDQAGAYVLVVDADGKVESRRVELGDQRGPQIIVLKGLNEGERVIVRGQQKVRPGITVSPHELKQAATAK